MDYRPFSSLDYSVHPVLRIFCVLLLCLVAYATVENAIHLFSAAHLAPFNCLQVREGKRWKCEVENWFISLFPEELQGPIEAVAHLLFALFLIYPAWLLLKPLLSKKATN